MSNESHQALHESAPLNAGYFRGELASGENSNPVFCVCSRLLNAYARVMIMCIFAIVKP